MRIGDYTTLTKREEEAGLYREPSRIGLRTQWLALLKQSGFTHEGHTLVPVHGNCDASAEVITEMGIIARHRTAIKRYDLSKPVKGLLERGLLRKNDSFFDFGCGHGMDVEALRRLGYQASGWDPAFQPCAPKVTASVVNLGYVLNVIEAPEERLTALREAYSLTERVLLVTTLVNGQETEAHSRAYADGFLTKANTFQKFYASGELEDLIEQTLGVEATTLGLGLCLVFRNDADAELFEASRNRRRIDWGVNTQVRFPPPARRQRRIVDGYELNQELFGSFWQKLLELGRAPEPDEFDRLQEVKRAAGGIKPALEKVVSHNGEELWRQVRAARTEDVLVYLAMTKFRKRFLQRDISPRTNRDIRSFFGDLATAQARAHDLLFAAGDPGEIDVACEALDIGWQDESSLVIHRSLIDKLPPILRIFVHCAARRYGDPTQADLIKVHKHSSKITFQHYDDFEGNPFPELLTRIKVNLRNLFVEVFDHSKHPKRQLLLFKERFLGSAHPGRPTMEKLSTKVRKVGFDEKTVGYGPDKATFIDLLARSGLNANLNRTRTKT